MLKDKLNSEQRGVESSLDNSLRMGSFVVSALNLRARTTLGSRTFSDHQYTSCAWVIHESMTLQPHSIFSRKP